MRKMVRRKIGRRLRCYYHPESDCLFAAHVGDRVHERMLSEGCDELTFEEYLDRKCEESRG